MLRRPRHDEEEHREWARRIDRMAGRIYVFFAIGLVMRVAQIRPEKISISGVELGIGNSEALPGVFFIVCLAYYLAMIGSAIHGLVLFPVGETNILRMLIYRATGSKRRLIGRSTSEVAAVKHFSRILYTSYMLAGTAFLLLPGVYITFFEAPAILAVIKLLH
jgi:hypothetical protein